MINTHAIQIAIEQLINNSLANRAKIEKSKASSVSLRNEIQIISLELERDSPIFPSREKESLSLSRKVASEDDCNLLRASIDTISKHIKDNQTSEALALTDRLKQNATLLRKRLQYIAELEQLLHEYEQEKQIRAKLKTVAEVLGLPMQDAGELAAEPTTFEANPTFTTVDNPLTEKTSSNPTLH